VRSLFPFVLLLSYSLHTWASGTQTIDLVSALKSAESYQRFFQIQADQFFPKKRIGPSSGLLKQDPILSNGLSLNSANDQAEAINLLQWVYVDDPNYTLPPPYQRTKNFKGWIRDPSHQSCFDIRSIVLYRQARGPVTTSPNNPCVVYSSKWLDPYSNQYFYKASDLDIDHVVPLKNAYEAGAWSWTPAKRCNYANFLADAYHLLVVQSSENRSKGSDGPNKYLPINPQFQCFYLAIWLRIKAFWNLKIAFDEANAIRQFFQAHSCPLNYFSLPRSEFLRIKAQVENPPIECMR